MTLLAATATSHPATVLPISLAAVLVWSALAAVLWLTVYLLRCAVAPFGPCRRCEGEGKIRPRPGGIRRKARYCRRCEGTGLRLRIGRRAINYARRHRNGT
ncbi:hypothetical protein [Sphaerisporangium aureirubrum]|uniref:Uncharacterized protein n=1 Tax=Sphaerisporangium aureirubrum TaxID=1544736 RepID=A0ABW1NG50_9ACTN